MKKNTQNVLKLFYAVVFAFRSLGHVTGISIDLGLRFGCILSHHWCQYRFKICGPGHRVESIAMQTAKAKFHYAIHLANGSRAGLRQARYLLASCKRAASELDSVIGLSHTILFASSSLTDRRPASERLKFSAIFLWHLVPWPSIDIHEKFYGDHQRRTPPSRELNTRGVAKYSDFEAIEGYIISETLQDRR